MYGMNVYGQCCRSSTSLLQALVSFMARDINITFTWLLHDLTHINMMPKGL